MLLLLVWSGKASGSVITGAMLSILTYFSEQPSQLLRTLLDDPDLEAHIIETYFSDDNLIKFTSRGLDMSEQEKKYIEIAKAGPEIGSNPDPFYYPKTFEKEIRTTEELQKAISTITIQLWILLTKAVTAPDTAKDSETKRWIKYLQQKRVDDEYRLKNQWLDLARARIAEDISVRRLMVNILISINKSTGTKGRLLESISDIGHYISEAGMASFFLTIKYGIETRLPPLALNEFQGDLTTMASLMKLYKDQGDKAPYLTILEDSIQTKFAPGNYSLLWSYAMGVGVALEKSMNNLNFNRPFLDPNYFRLGQEVIVSMEGNVDTKMAQDLGLTEDQISNLKKLIRDDNHQIVSAVPKGRVSGYGLYTDEDEEENPQPKLQSSAPSIQSKIPRQFAVKSDNSEKDKIQKRLAEIMHKPRDLRSTTEQTVNIASTAADDDIDVMNAV